MKFYHIILIISLFLYYINIQGQTEMTTEKFDIETFDKNNQYNEYNFILEDGTRIRQTGGTSNYIEYITPPPPNLLEIYKQYYLTGELQRYIISFPNDFLILKKEYDKEGNLLEEINYDKPYKFTFEQLVELLKKEEDTIDLYDKNTSIVRGVVEDGVFWEVEYKKTDDRRETMLIDGITGKILKRGYNLHVDN